MQGQQVAAVQLPLVNSASGVAVIVRRLTCRAQARRTIGDGTVDATIRAMRDCGERQPDRSQPVGNGGLLLPIEKLCPVVPSPRE